VTKSGEIEAVIVVGKVDLMEVEIGCEVMRDFG